MKYNQISLWSAGVGIALGVGLFVLITAFKPDAPAPTAEQQNPWEGRFHDLETQSSQTIDGLNREIQKQQQKLARAEERCLSYQKLVDVHQNEIDKSKQDNAQMGQHVIEKDRQLKELQLARIEPDLFDAEKRQAESSHRELKKQFEEKSQALDQARIRLFRAESELLLLQKEKEEQTRIFNPSESKLIDQLKYAEDEKKKLESELVSLQQLVSELSSSKSPTQKREPMDGLKSRDQSV
jgi:chromosome segregation ATPase